MIINTSPNEKETHIMLKKKAIELLNKRDDVISIETEYRSRIRGKYFSYVDVRALKEDGGSIYVEVKSDNTMPSAIAQLARLDKGNKDDEFVVVCNFDKLYYFKSIWRKELLAWQKFINKTQIYTFNDNLEFKRVKVEYINGKELWIDGLKVI